MSITNDHATSVWIACDWLCKGAKGGWRQDGKRLQIPLSATKALIDALETHRASRKMNYDATLQICWNNEALSGTRQCRRVGKFFCREPSTNGKKAPIASWRLPVLRDGNRS